MKKKSTNKIQNAADFSLEQGITFVSRCILGVKFSMAWTQTSQHLGK
jgi:hypothetical protein